MWPKTSVLVALLSLLWFSFSTALPAQNSLAIRSPDRSLGGNILQSRANDAVDDTTWNNAVQRGNDWVLAMKSSAAKARVYLKPGVPVTSSFTHYDALEEWGWTQDHSSYNPNEDSDLDTIFSDLKINKANNQEIGWLQSEEFGDDVDPTDAYYWSVYNIVDGAIVAESTLSPHETACGGPTPDLQTWSDVTFLQWQQLFVSAGSTSSISNLNYIIQHNVINPTTLDYIRRALGKPAGFDDWSQIKDGKSWDWGKDEFKALLTTPNGRGAFWFLVQHKPQLGIRAVTEIKLQSTQQTITHGGTKSTAWIVVMIMKVENVS
ncbi:uncharacterized protein N7459_004394 [Penicillium hispanicum]|uniref:uncharacterized protein n=1 Tax=Penicillium hispanicum TaxID=1080232 RepID=UPI002541C1AB|nr:uncharacterized protein N7459_004394 [Penicillium hispanicum]KAJ5584594.1 hypothetical protein N7459_004394 [Penicillium hispanicum]